MAELIDYLLLFWATLGALVCVFGQIYQQQLAHKQSKQLPKQQDHDAKWRQERHTTQPPSTTNLDDFSSNTSNNLYHQQGATGRANSNSNYYPDQYSEAGANYRQLNRASAYFNSPTQQQEQAEKFYNQQGPAAAYGALSTTAGLEQRWRGHNENDTREHWTRTQLDDKQQQRGWRQADADLNYQSITSCASIPTATGFNSDCVDWVNSILYAFYTQAHKYGPIIADNVCRSLNEKLSNIMHSSSDYSHLAIEFTSIKPETSTRPELTNIRTEIESDKSVSVCCKIYNKRVTFELSVQRLYGGGDTTTSATSDARALAQTDLYGHNAASIRPAAHYELALERLEGKLKAMAVLNDKLIVVQFMEKPDTKMLLNRLVSAESAAGVQSSTLISDDALVQIVLQALTQVVVDLYFGDDLDFPHFSSSTTSGEHQAAHHHHHHHHHGFGGGHKRTGSFKHKLSNMFRTGAGELGRQIKDELLGALGGQTTSADQAWNRRVFVKILRATNINYNQNVTCILELDVPHQRALSSTRHASSNPVWDEHFLFQLTDRTHELSVELWESLKSPNEGAKCEPMVPGRNEQKSQLIGGAKFLGKARVPLGLDELKRNPVQRASLSLQPLGQSSDLSQSVGGELALELLYLESVPPSSPQQSASPSPVPGALKKSTSSSSLGVLPAASYAPGDMVSIDRKMTPSGYVITTTTITKPVVSRARGRQQQHQQQHQHRRPASVEDLAQQQHHHQYQPRSDTPAGASCTSGGDARSEGPPDSLATRSTGGRTSRSRSRSLLRAIKKRLSFSRTRSRSLGPGADDELAVADFSHDTGSVSPASVRSDAPPPPPPPPTTITSNAPVHSNRPRAPSELSAQSKHDARAKSVPVARDPGELPTIVINRGRLSDTASALTFTHPKSQLVIEVHEPSLERERGGQGRQKTRPRYYAVPEQSANKRKWSRKGLKLHLFNEHQFVACHLDASSTCHLCGRVFSRRPGKQGYKCRNCHLLSHKQCHVKVDHNCPYAAANELALEYIDADPPTELATQLAGRPAKSMRHMVARSVSLEADEIN